MEAVDELLGVDLVRVTDVPRRFRFRHPLVRRAVYEATAAGWRLGAHERCAEALAARGATAAARAHHIQRSAREGDVDAVAVLARPARRRAARADERRALVRGRAAPAPADAPAEERVELLLARAGALTAAGHYTREQRSAPGGGGARARGRTARSEPGSRRTFAGVESLLGKHEEAGARLASALASLSDQGSTEAVALMIELADERASGGRGTRRCGSGRGAPRRLHGASATGR